MVKRKAKDHDSIYSRVERMVMHNDILDIEFISRTEEFKTSFEKINEIHYKVLDFHFDLLALSAYHSATDCFKFIHKVLESSISGTETLLFDQGSSLIDIICTRGNTELLEYYLPNFTSNPNPYLNEDATYSLNLSNNGDEYKEKIYKKNPNNYTAVQKACEIGSINILSYIYKYFESRAEVPYELDIHHQDEISGENCALIACRRANYTMIKFLHMTCKANFRIFNKQGENALQILAATNQRTPVKDFHEIFVYLVNFAGVDLLYNYEETLLLVSCDRTVKFIKKRFRERGISFDKEKIEEKNMLVRVEHVRTHVEEKIDMLSGKDIPFCRLFGEVMDHDDEISNIDPYQKETPFSSILEPEV